jgi:tRNA uridine 5-carboxymethylaminomethyl modification enzyme
LSTEEKRALETTRPESLGQARRVEGVTPTGALRILAYIKSENRRSKKERMVKETMEGMAPGNEVEVVA